MNRFLRSAYSVTYVFLYLTIFSVVATESEMPLPAFLCLYSGVLIAHLPSIHEPSADKQALFGVLGIVIALLGFIPLFIYGCNLVHIIMYLVGVVSGVLFYFFGQREFSRDRFRGEFRNTIIIAFIAAFVATLIVIPVLCENDPKKSAADDISMVIKNVVPVVIMLLVTGILLLRGLRSEQGGIDPKVMERRQLRDLGIFAALVTVVYAVNPFKYLASAALFFFNSILRPAVIWLLKIIASIIEWFFKADPRMFEEAAEEMPTAEPYPTQNILESTPAPTHAFELSEIKLRTEDFVYIAIGVAVIIGVIILAALLGKLAKRRKVNRGYPNETVEDVDAEEKNGPERKPKKRSSDPRLRIRYQYMEFMKYLKRSSVKLRKSDTSGEIGLKAKDALEADNAEIDSFSDVYGKARYNLKEAPSASDAERMKNTFESIRRSGRKS